jgi:hypothetical protein
MRKTNPNEPWLDLRKEEDEEQRFCREGETKFSLFQVNSGYFSLFQDSQEKRGSKQEGRRNPPAVVKNDQSRGPVKVVQTQSKPVKPLFFCLGRREGRFWAVSGRKTARQRLAKARLWPEIGASRGRLSRIL